MWMIQCRSPFPARLRHAVTGVMPAWTTAVRVRSSLYWRRLNAYCMSIVRLVLCPRVTCRAAGWEHVHQVPQSSTAPPSEAPWLNASTEFELPHRVIVTPCLVDQPVAPGIIKDGALHVWGRHRPGTQRKSQSVHCQVLGAFAQISEFCQRQQCQPGPSRRLVWLQ